MDYKVFIPVLISFVLSVILGPLVIPVLRRQKMDQTVSDTWFWTDRIPG